jgi:DNA polymerase sigma
MTPVNGNDGVSPSSSSSSTSKEVDDFGQLLLCFLDFFGRHFDFERYGIALTPQTPDSG